MWCFRRELDCHKTWTGAPSDIGFVTVFAYVRVPLDQDEAAASQARFLATSPAITQLKELEMFVCGFSTGHVLRCEVLPSAVVPQLREGEELKLIRQLHRHEGGGGGDSGASSDVMAVATIGTICATVAGDKTCRLSFLHPLPCDTICTLTHPDGVRSVMLHEGKKSWTDANPAAEAAALYVYTGDDVGILRLWRVDVVEKAFFLHTVLAAGAYGNFGDASLVHAHESAVAARLFGKPLYQIAIDGNEAEEADRLLAITDGRLVCFDSRRFVGYKNAEWDHPLIGGGGVSHDMNRLRRMVGEHVWCKSDVAVLKALKDYDERRAMSPSVVTGEPTKWKAKHEAVVAQGRAIGCVTNEVVVQGPLAEDALIPCSFPVLTNTALWPTGCIEQCVMPSLVVNVDHDHSRPVFSVVVCAPGRVVTGDAAGHLKVWQFAPEATASSGDSFRGLYTIMFDIADAHDGHLVKAIGVLRRPDVFVSFGYDGSFREWHVFDEPAACARAAVVTVADKQAADGSDKMGLCWGVVAEEFAAVFVVSLFETSIRTYALMACDTCEIPPGFVYNGIQTVRVS